MLSYYHASLKDLNLAHCTYVTRDSLLGDQKIKDPVAIPYDSGITLAWSVDPTSSACVTHYHVLRKSQNGSTTAYNTTDSTFRWTGDPCKVEFVTVQPASEDELIGQPVFIFLQKQFEGKKTKTNNCEMYLIDPSSFVEQQQSWMDCGTLNNDFYKKINLKLTDVEHLISDLMEPGRGRNGKKAG